MSFQARVPTRLRPLASAAAWRPALGPLSFFVGLALATMGSQAQAQTQGQPRSIGLQVDLRLNVPQGGGSGGLPRPPAALPGLSGLPALPALPAPPAGRPGLPSLGALPGLSALPGLGALPALPGLPRMGGGTPPPSSGARAGTNKDYRIASPATGDIVAVTVFEPTVFTPGQKYPLVLHGHGFGGSRAKTSSNDTANPTAIQADASIQSLRDAGYGVISIDQRGHGDSTGGVRVMDPDFEGKNLIRVLDWAEVNLNWLAYGSSVDGTDPRNLIVGAMGGSYGGMYQLLLAHIDPKKRLDAIVPEIAPHHLPYSLAPGSVPKSIWDVFLFTAGLTAGKNTGNTFDPYVIRNFPLSLAQNRLVPGLEEFFSYHSTSYWCDGKPIPTNGGPGTRPQLAPRQAPKVHALFVQGMRDTLFNFNEGFQNYSCLKKSGGDVRLLSTQTGHNTIPVVPDAGLLLNQDPQDIVRNQCGRIQVAAARKAFFDQYLKGIPNAAVSVPKQVCISLTGSDAVLVDQVTTGRDGERFDVPTTTVVSGLLGKPAVVPLGTRTTVAGDVIAGIPHLAVQIDASVPELGGEPIVFAALGVVRDSGFIEPLDNQIMPLRGTGSFDLALPGVGERLRRGDQLALLIYGAHEQFFAGGSLVSLNLRQATLMPVKVKGAVWVPRLDVNTPAP